MLAQRLALSFRLSRILSCSVRRSLLVAPNLACRPFATAVDAFEAVRKQNMRVEARLSDEGLPLHHSGPTTAALLSYAVKNWPAPAVIPAGWSADWKQWDYLLTLFAFSPYFLRLPQIEMLVNVKYGIPGEVRPIMYSDARESVVFSTEIPTDPDAPDDAPDGAGHVFLLNCRTFELYTYDPARPEHAPDTIEELALLIAAAPTPEGVPMVQLQPDPDGEAALQRVLARDATVIPLLESDFLGYAPRATEPEQELVSADAAAEAQKQKLAEAIRKVRAYVVETEAELALDEAELADLRTDGSPELQDKEDGVRLDEEAHAQMRVALEEAKAKLKIWEHLWTESYGPWVDAPQLRTLTED
ncbi:hypothetical protein B0H19DRAFT_1158070 [Mycena capillaripes]|nr:hypothetical protein B0H19DRAFT_1158070 [Mycena capillaripes]